MNYKNPFLIAVCGIALSLGQANAQSDTFNYPDSLQTWTVPSCTSSITITAYGAQGGPANSNANLGGLGAEIQGQFSVVPGQVLTIVVGAMGVSAGVNPGSGGGGGSAVIYSGTPWIVAGGGGGRDFGGYADADAVTSNNGQPGDGCCSYGGAAGTGGGDGQAVGYPNEFSGPSFAYGGRGFNSGNNGSDGQNGYSPSTTYTSGTWGLGGGGGGVGNGQCNCGGGGGGYSGGGSGGINGDGGGGGSYNIGSNQTNLAGVQSGNGQVIITWAVGGSPLVLSPNVIENVTCNGGDTGRAYAVITGGGTPYTYSWTPSGGSGDTASGLTAGTYTLTVTDPCAQTATTTVSITQPTPLVVSASVTANDSCHGEADGSASSTVSGGAGSYVYSWTGGGTNSTVSGLTAGTYTLSVQDANGCTGTATVAITQPAALAIVPNSSPDNGGNDGKAWVSVSGGVSPYSYLWTGGNTTDSISGKDSGMYCCRITDANGCKDSVCIAIGSTLGIGNIASGSRQIMVYPNPNNGQFTIQSSVGSGQLSVEVYNVLGEKVFSGNLNPGNNTINMSNQSNGIYLYRVMSENGTLVSEGKITLQK